MRISLDEAASRLKNGEVVAIPTETVYGLAADATNDAALQQIFTIKQRPAD
ncbi:MAG: L-threonylcarbamoyladenylate synthase, partial [Methylotenera sp.]